jgi:hypothetical protein
MQRFQLYIDGTFTDGSGSFDSIDPATGQPWAVMSEARTADVNRAVDAAHRAFRSREWAGLTASARGKLLYKLADLVQAADPAVDAELRAKLDASVAALGAAGVARQPHEAGRALEARDDLADPRGQGLVAAAVVQHHDLRGAVRPVQRAQQGGRIVAESGDQHRQARHQFATFVGTEVQRRQ